MGSSRRVNKERTRARLIEATLELLRTEGRSSLTTGRVAQQAGVAQPTFYVHFGQMDEALEGAAEAMVHRLMERLELVPNAPAVSGASAMSSDSAAASASVSGGASVSSNSLNADPMRCTIARLVGALLSEPQLAEVFLRHRRDSASPLGRESRVLTRYIERQVVSALKVVGSAPAQSSPELHAELIVGMALAVVEGSLDQRITDLDVAIDVVARSAERAVGAADVPANPVRSAL